MSPEIGREFLGNIPFPLQAAMYAATLGASGVAAVKILLQVRRWSRGRSEERLLPLSERLRDLFRRAVVQRSIGDRDPFAGVMHRMIFWGFAVLFVATVLTGIEHDLGFHLLHGAFYLIFAFAADFFGLLFVVGVSLAIVRRYVLRPPFLSHVRPGDAAALVFLLLVGLTGFWLEGARIALEGWPAHERLSFVGWMSGLLLSPFVPAGDWSAPHRILWSLHVAAIVALFASLPFTRLLHMFATPANILFRARPLGALKPQPEDEIPQATLESFTWKQLLELDACTSCGRCSAACPATAAGKPLSPMLVVQRLRERMSGERNGNEILGGVLHPDELWSCTTCGACEETCPVAINHIDRIVDLRRVLVDRGEVQPTAVRGLESLRGKENPFDAPPAERARWAERLGVRVLQPGEPCETIYWVGCAGAFDEQARKVSEAVATLLQRAKIDFGILGPREGCSGDLARRIGEEGLFVEAARRNVEMLRAHGAKRVVTHCPHCLNSLTKEHGLDGIEVIHHSVLLKRLLDEGRLKLTREVARRMTYHDPCYLGRYNGIFDEARAAIQAIPRAELAEMPRSRERSFCCGGGGGQMLLEVRSAERVPNLRFAEAAELGVDLIVTACPFCKIMLAPAAAEGSAERRIVVKDMAEILAEACE